MDKTKKIHWNAVILTLAIAISSCANKDPVLEASTPSPTALIDGLYKSGCWNLDIDSDSTTDGIKVVFKLENGKSYSGYLFYNHDTACAGAGSLRNPNDFTVTTDLVLDSTNIEILSLTGAPANFYGMTGYDVATTGTNYNVLYRQDADHLYLLADAILTNPGSTWTAWTSAAADVASFEAAPTTFTPGSGGAEGGGDSTVVPLTAATSIF